MNRITSFIKTRWQSTNRITSFIKTRWQSTNKKRLRLLVEVFVLAVVVGVAFNSMWGDPNLSTAVVALGTLLLAIATAVAIDVSRAREQRDREERKLRDVIQWATDVCELVSVESVADPSQLEGAAAANFIWDRRQELNRFRTLRARCEYIVRIAEEHTTLKESVEELRQHLTGEIQLLFGFDAHWPPGDEALKKDANKVWIKNERIYNCARSIIERASSLF